MLNFIRLQDNITLVIRALFFCILSIKSVKILLVINLKSLWTDNIKMPEFRNLSGDKSCDVLIIGGGITGILTAYFLDKNNVDYILVEKEKICNGTISNTTAKITAQHGLIYSKILNRYGLESAQLYLKANLNAISVYKELSKDIDCDFLELDNYVYSLNNKSKLEEEVSALEKIGYNAQLTEINNLPFKTLGAVKFASQAQFHPLKFLSGISKKLNILENTKVTQMIGNTAITSDGKITAKAVIVATHFPFLNKHGNYFLKLYQHRSYVSAFENAPNLNGMYVDENDKGLSLRNYNNLLILGGEGHRTGKKSCGWDILRKTAKEYYPAAKEKYYWAAQDCMSLDSIPYIGRYSNRTTNLYTATGFNKWGITGAMVSAQILSDIITDKRNEFAELFNPSRSILKPQLFINGFESLINLLTPTIRRCPHLGCALKWNKHERSWDCSCHGSRFSNGGKLLENPANNDLK